METLVRKPFQGVLNIVRFNWHFYLIAIASISILILGVELYKSLAWLLWPVAMLIFISVLVSLSVSYYIYDLSDFYSLHWLHCKIGDNQTMVNINAGFDETSSVLTAKFPKSKWRVMDFYNSSKHTEVSIERARKAFPPHPATEKIETDQVPLTEKSVDFIFLIFAAHEIRDSKERINFLKKLKASLKPNGKILLVEHPRDIANFLAYNFGFFHFLSLKTWRQNFLEADLEEQQVIRFTPFVKIITLA
jgi:SAM-dependent methyltransferase